MLANLPLTLDSPALLAAGIGLSAAATIIARLRHTRTSPLGSAAFLIAMILLSLSAAGIGWRHQSVKELLVLIDVSPSTRVAEYRDREALHKRISQLAGQTPYRLEYFADGVLRPPVDRPHLPDVTCQRTTLPPATADAVLLFSDCRFELPPWAPPTDIVVDRALESVSDAAVHQLEMRADSQIAVEITNTGQPRQ